jgi:hypothetical protein
VYASRLGLWGLSGRGSPPAGCDKVVKGWLDKALVLLQHTRDVTPTVLHIPLDATRQAYIVVCISREGKGDTRGQIGREG